MDQKLEKERQAADLLREARKAIQEQQFAQKEAREIKAEKIEILEEIVAQRQAEVLNAAEANNALAEKQETSHKGSQAFEAYHELEEEENISHTAGHSYIRPADEAAATEAINNDIRKAAAAMPGLFNALFGENLPQAEVVYGDTSVAITLGENTVKIINHDSGEAAYQSSAQDARGIIKEAVARTGLMYNVTDMAQAKKVDFSVAHSIADSMMGPGPRAEALNDLRDGVMAITAASMHKPITVNGCEFHVGSQQYKDMRTELTTVARKENVMSQLLEKGHSGLKSIHRKAKHEEVKPIEPSAQATVDKSEAKPASVAVERAREKAREVILKADAEKIQQSAEVKAAPSIPKAGGGK